MNSLQTKGSTTLGVNLALCEKQTDYKENEALQYVRKKVKKSCIRKSN